ncbi:hypothetical protein BJY00DRAFT_277436 [Aspergillus carlsbadensis]|nr:hypothetical protein BJY00DRAFT_277436 [Aspergillus carlsbadensis]
MGKKASPRSLCVRESFPSVHTGPPTNSLRHANRRRAKLYSNPTGIMSTSLVQLITSNALACEPAKGTMLRDSA